MADLRGGCACGAVRYRLASAPSGVGWCHCRICQRSSGASGLIFASVPTPDFVIERGADAIGTFRATDVARRQFCSRCGTPLTFQMDARPATIDFTVISLDEPDAVPPEFHIFQADAIGWAETADSLPRHAGFPPRSTEA